MEPRHSVAGEKRLAIRRMEDSDIPEGMRLCSLAGWNQIERDWSRFLALEPAGCFVASLDGTVCGTATAVDYGRRFGWIGMVLVDPGRRGEGLGTLLLKTAMDYLDRNAVETMRLDATPMGHNLYLRLGFLEEFGIVRWQGTAAATATVRLQPMSRDELELVCRWDSAAFGANRAPLLRLLWEESPRYSAVLFSGDDIVGYMLGRTGRRAHYMGPWVAAGEHAANELFQEFLARVPGETVFVDIPSVNASATALARSAGLSAQRPLTRMYRGPHRFPGRPEFICGIAGPELG